MVGSGGREHALCWSLAASPLVGELLCAPGSDAIAREARCVPVAADDIAGLVALCRAEQVELVVPGPELPLVLGLADRLDEAGIKVCGPTRGGGAARGVEGLRQGSSAPATASRPRAIAASGTTRRRRRAPTSAAEGAPIVIKADGLAAGKGVTVAATVEEALRALDEAFGGAFGAAGSTVVIEECLVGEEASLFALCDGRDLLAFGSAQDHKRVGEGDTGPNTGGMGAFAPAASLTRARSPSGRWPRSSGPRSPAWPPRARPIAASSTPA